MSSDAAIVAYIAGSQSGKTSVSPWWMAKEVERRGAGDYLAVTATYDLYKLRMLPAYLRVFCNILKIGKYWAVDKIIELRPSRGVPFQAERSQDPMWARIILRSAQSPGGLESTTANAVHADEAGQDAFGLDAWRAITRRIYASGGRVLVTSTLYNLGWLKRQLMDPIADIAPTKIITDTGEILVTHGNIGTRTIDLIQADSVINPAFSKSSWEDARATMPDDTFQLFFRGRVAKLRSLVYDCFSVQEHTCEPFDIPSFWPRFVGIDPVGDRIAAVWLAWDRDHLKLYAYRVYLEPFGETTHGHAQNIMNLSKDERVFGWVGGGPSERQARTDWEAAGIPIVEPTATNVWVGIGRVYSLFKTGNLVIFRSCDELISELLSMRRKQIGDNYTMDILNKDVYHSADALRYACTAIAEPTPQEKIIYDPVQIV